ncbi:hypothetical protein U9M48_004877 [Paspalum notatum var. saurae]|uniref:Uncharacterized protein n=1 Tax=Paspalum notatum var. saurae TaxID=547442 RepID=A0AAQ3SJE6_PASNO
MVVAWGMGERPEAGRGPFWASFGRHPSKIANALSVINGLDPLDGSNYPSWREKLMMALTMADIDYAIENPRMYRQNWQLKTLLLLLIIQQGKCLMTLRRLSGTVLTRNVSWSLRARLFLLFGVPSLNVSLPRTTA